MDRRRFVSLVGAALVAGCGSRREGSDATGEVTGTRPSTASPAPSAGTRTPAPTPAETTPGSTPAETTPTPTATPIRPEYEQTEVVARTRDGQRLGSVTAAIADTSRRRYVGLSETPSLPEGRGLLFVFPEAGEYTFVMRGMDFGIDIVYAAPDGTITRIHHAEAPGPGEDGRDQRYPGTGQYVLEVVLGWTTERGVEAGDLLEFDLSGIT